MTRETIIIAFRFIFLVLVQTLILNNIYFFDYINPNLYILFIFLYPLGVKRTNFLIVSFLLGLSIDLFSNSGGINAAATVAIAYLRLPILKLLINSQDVDLKLFKLHKESFFRVLTYISILTFTHHFVLIGLEYSSIKEIGAILHKTITTSLFTIFLCTLSIYLFSKNKTTNF
ncbi:rod shape-determining protein MreD [Flavicella sp.]|uniref:rod shape-determining protein MreD n=1 Tax=Flavicella sp. TaxID=2957742 RepID=UPI003018B4F6